MASYSFVPVVCVALAFIANGADQTKVGEGNARAEEIGRQSLLVQSAVESLVRAAHQIGDAKVRRITLDAFTNPRTCIAHRAGLTADRKARILQELLQEGLLNPNDGALIEGGLTAGVFPPVEHEGSSCPQAPLSFAAAAGGEFGGHHSYPGGLALRESFNAQIAISLAAAYRGQYGKEDTPDGKLSKGSVDELIDEDAILAAPIWHDWGKMLVFQWTAQGTEFEELKFGGNGSTDKFGAAGDSRTGAHHIISLAEAMVRGLPPELLITQACAHSAPTLGSEYKVVNWLRAAAIVAQVDPIAAGLLARDAKGHFRLAPLRSLSRLNLLARGETNLLIEYQIHNLSDADFTNSIPAVREVESLLAGIAARFGYDSADTARYNNHFRNVILAYLSAEHLEMLVAESGLDGLLLELEGLRRQKLI